MRLITRLLFVMMLVALTVPAFAQEETDFDPEADFTNTYTYQNITLSHPDVVILSDANFQITLAFNPQFSDYITIALPQAFDYFGIPKDDILIASQAVFENFAVGFNNTTPYEEAVTVIEFAGLDEVYAFSLNLDVNLAVYAYTFAIDDHIFAATLITQEAIFPADVELRVLERVLESMVIDGDFTDPFSGNAEPTADVFAEITPDPIVELTPEATSEIAETRPAPEETEIESASEITLYEGEIVVTIPNTWIVVEENYTVATSNVASDAVFGDVDLDEGEIALQIISPSRMEELILDETNLATVSEALASQFSAPIYTYEGLPYEAYLMFVSGIGVPDGAFFIVFQLGEDVADVGVIIGVTPDYDSAEGLIIAIVNTIVYTPTPAEPEA